MAWHDNCGGDTCSKPCNDGDDCDGRDRRTDGDGDRDAGGPKSDVDGSAALEEAESNRRRRARRQSAAEPERRVARRGDGVKGEVAREGFEGDGSGGGDRAGTERGGSKAASGKLSCLIRSAHSTATLANISSCCPILSTVSPCLATTFSAHSFCFASCSSCLLSMFACVSSCPLSSADCRLTSGMGRGYKLYKYVQILLRNTICILGSVYNLQPRPEILKVSTIPSLQM